MALLACAPTPAATLAVLSHPCSAATPTAPVVALAALLAWIGAAYLVTVALLVLGSRAPGFLGWVMARVARAVAPVALRRALEVGLGVSLVVGSVGGPIGAGAALASTGAAATRAASAAAARALDAGPPSLDVPVLGPAPAGSAAPDLDWPRLPADPVQHVPADEPAHQPAEVAPPRPEDPALRTPAGATPQPSTEPVEQRPAGTPDGGPAASGPADDPRVVPRAGDGPLPRVVLPRRASGLGPASATPRRTAAGRLAVTSTDRLNTGSAPPLSGSPVPRTPVVVHPGDSLWSLAAAGLGEAATPARVAAQWPRWWQANREVIGDDPDLLRPGTPLVPPAR